VAADEESRGGVLHGFTNHFIDDWQFPAVWVVIGIRVCGRKLVSR